MSDNSAPTSTAKPRRPTRAVLLVAGLLIVLLAAAGWIALDALRSLLSDSPSGNPDRAPMVLYLSLIEAPELWIVSPDGTAPRQITSTGGQVLDYAPDPTGERIALAVKNDQNGIDLWEMERQGDGWSQPVEILPCGADFCINPAYEPNGARIAYTRRVVETASGPPGVPRVWLLELPSGATDLWTSDPNVGGFEPSWSPDGRYLSFFDGLSGGMRVVDLQAGEDFLVESEMGMPGAWSPDSRSLLTVQLDPVGGQPSVTVHRLDVQTRKSERVLEPGGHQSGVEFSVPDWSPDGEWVVVAQRLLSGSPSKQLFLARLDGSGWQPLSEEPRYNHTVPRWEPDGKGVVYQRLELGSSDSRPEVAYWDRASGAVTVLAEDAFQPRWLR